MTKKTEVTMDRRAHTDRRSNEDRRQENTPVQVERRTEERRKVQRRRQIDPTTCERDYTDDEIEFMQALDDYKRASARMFPTCSEILEVIRGLGYQKVTEAGEVAVQATAVLEETATEEEEDLDTELSDEDSI